MNIVYVALAATSRKSDNSTMNTKTFFYVQGAAILGGTVFAWYSVTVDFLRFYATEGTIWKIFDCVYPNPVVTPCFWGAVLFGVLLFLVIRLRRGEDLLKRQRRIMMLLVAGTIFAWANFSVSSWSFFLAPKGEGTSCSGVPVDSPIGTPCFYGAIFFTASLVAGLLYFRALKKGLPA